MSDDRTTQAMLVARQLAARRGECVVFAGVNLTICPGDLYLLRGVNGAGKTTLLRALAGLSPHASGAVQSHPAITAFLGHADGVKATLTARENISFWSSLYGVDTAAADRAIAALEIAPYLDRRAATLSAGQKRRLALCRVALSGRALWLLDEPTAGMDAASVKAAIDLITEHCRNGGGAVVSTHEPLPFPCAITITLAAPALA